MLIHHIAKGKKKGGKKFELVQLTYNQKKRIEREQIVRKREVIELMGREVDTRMCIVITWESEAENDRNQMK